MIRPASLALLLLLAAPADAATVLSVEDCDTLCLVDGSKRLTIRMACIDAPVSGDSEKWPRSDTKSGPPL